jgi:hypothetical protein
MSLQTAVKMVTINPAAVANVDKKREAWSLAKTLKLWQSMTK